jgi:conjugative transfer signal peptidase TraF
MVARDSTVHNGEAARQRSTIAGRTSRLAALLASLLLAALGLHAYGLSLNVTDSMPIGLYHLEKLRLPVARGTIVLACLPAPIAALGRRQGYLMGGSCPDGAAPVLKIAAAAGGDRVQLLDRQILVNGHALPGSGTLRRDRNGRALVHVARGMLTLRRGDLWFWTPNPASWDSRYYGPVSEGNVLGRDTLLMKFGAWDFAGAKS